MTGQLMKTNSYEADQSQEESCEAMSRCEKSGPREFTSQQYIARLTAMTVTT